jgi:hypothetical protein
MWNAIAEYVKKHRVRYLVSFARAGFAEQLKMLAFIDVNAAGYIMEDVSKVQPERAACLRETHL